MLHDKHIEADETFTVTSFKDHLLNADQAHLLNSTFVIDRHPRTPRIVICLGNLPMKIALRNWDFRGFLERGKSSQCHIYSLPHLKTNKIGALGKMKDDEQQQQAGTSSC